MSTPPVQCAPSESTSGAWYRTLFERSLDCLYIHDFDGHFLDANPAALGLLGYSRNEIPDLSFADVLSLDQTPAALLILKELLETGTQKELAEFRLRRRNGTFVDVETKASVIAVEGKPQAILGIARDISQRKKTELELRI